MSNNREAKRPSQLTGVVPSSQDDDDGPSQGDGHDHSAALAASYVSASGCFTKGGFKVGANGIVVSPATPILDQDSAAAAALNNFVAKSHLKLSDLKIGKTLGKGACGEVKRAVHNETNEVYALKCFDVHDESRRKQLLAELKAMLGVRCENLLSLHDVFFLNDTIYMALEFMDAGTLEQLIATRPAPTEAQAAAIIKQVTAGLFFMHRFLRQVHRDLKPGNVLVNCAGQVKISDFGLSRQMDSEALTQAFAQTFVGTLMYLSPERLKGENYSFSGDVWALGVIAYEIVHQMHPYKDCKNVFIELLQTMMESPTPQPDSSLGFTSQYADFINKCMEKDPKARPATNLLLDHPWLKKAAGPSMVASWVTE